MDQKLVKLKPPRFQLIGGSVGYNWDKMKCNKDYCQAMSFCRHDQVTTSMEDKV